jgi:PAS domain S-box-containing protein
MKARRQKSDREGTTEGSARFSRTNKAITTSEDSLGFAFENAPMGLAIVGLDHRLRRVNKSLCHALGYDAAELMERRFVDLTHPDDIARDTTLARKLFRGQIPSYRLEERFITKQGTLAWLDLTAVVIRKQTGDPLYGLAMVEDITDRKRSEEALRTSEERYRSFVVNSSEGIWRFELEQPIDTSLPLDDQVNLLYQHGYLAECNDALARMYGHDRAAALVGVRLGDFGVVSHPATPVSLRKLFRSNYRLRDLPSQKTEVDGSKRYFSSSLIGIVVNNMLLRVWGVQTDQTDQRMAGLALKRSQQQLRLLSAHIQSLREKERTNLARELHDNLGQTLTVLKIEISLLQKTLNGEIQTAIPEVEQRLNNIYEILGETMSAVKTLSTELRPGVLDKFGLTAAIDWQCKEFSRRSGIKCEFNVSRHKLSLSSETSTQLFRILQEALTNIARHSQARRATVRLGISKATVVFTISDNGNGISEKEMSDPNSLGLLGMRERAESFGGTFEIDGEPDGGTKIEVRVSLAGASVKIGDRK